MARGVSGWSGGVLLGVVLVIGYVALTPAHFRMGQPFDPAERSRTERDAAQAEHDLAVGEQELELLQLRRQVAESAQRTTGRDSSTLTVLVSTSSGRDPVRAAAYREALDTAWQGLGLGVTKVDVGVILVDRGLMRRWEQALGIRTGEPSAIYVLPDSLAPTTCVAIVVAPGGVGRPRPGFLASLAPGWLGPCAFLARFGLPGERVGRWLRARSYDVAAQPEWGGVTVATQRDPWSEMVARGSWYWAAIYFMPHTAIRCLAGRPAGCRDALRTGDEAAKSPDRGVVVESDLRWRFDRQGIVGAPHLLSAVLQAAGPRRFEAFWHTELPVDSALTIALARPVGEWTADWELGRASRPHLGPAPRGKELLFSAALVLFSFGVLARGAGRREVR
ncbi:MAG TPA: hypothetical protein VFI13_05190 [Gemmatimonadales bacterium]|nr:hypothetical protein [Gemmatimonadales bacterium]